MTIIDLITKAVNYDIEMKEAITELDKMGLPANEYEKAINLLKTFLGNEGEYINPLNGIPDTMVAPLYEEVLDMLLDDMFVPEITEILFKKYRISAGLISFFIDSAMTDIKMISAGEESEGETEEIKPVWW